jgi:hypothetical protein
MVAGRGGGQPQNECPLMGLGSFGISAFAGPARVLLQTGRRRNCDIFNLGLGRFIQMSKIGGAERQLEESRRPQTAVRLWDYDRLVRRALTGWWPRKALLTLLYRMRKSALAVYVMFS